jgi:putative Mg2+ transporter-C (MgtC) family protein
MQPEQAFDLPTAAAAVAMAARLIVAALLGGALGFERQMLGKAAGLRTHMLVALGAALFVIASREAGATPGDLTRVTQGIATGIGFVGAGSILKSAQEHEVRGLTTAASVWLTAAVGMAVGTGALWLPVLGVALALVILSALRRLEALV